MGLFDGIKRFFGITPEPTVAPPLMQTPAQPTPASTPGKWVSRDPAPQSAPKSDAADGVHLPPIPTRHAPPVQPRSAETDALPPRTSVPSFDVVSARTAPVGAPPQAGGDTGPVSGSDFVKLAEAQIKNLQGEQRSIDKLLADHTGKAAEVQAAMQQSLDALVGELLPNLDRATWDNAVKLTGFALKNAPIGDKSPQALDRVQKELALFIKHSDRATLGQSLEPNKRLLQLYKRLDGLSAKVAYMDGIAEKYATSKAEIDKQILEIGKQILAARGQPNARIDRTTVNQRLGTDAWRRRQDVVKHCSQAYQRVYVYNNYDTGPSFFETWFWWNLMTGGFNDTYYVPNDVQSYMQDHPDYVPPPPYDPNAGANQPQDPDQQQPPQQDPDNSRRHS